jgi:hypothetical protein
MVLTTDIVIIGNMLVNVTLLLVYLYRVKIEKKQIRIMERSAEANNKLGFIAALVRRERSDILSMRKEELVRFLNLLEELGTKHE